MPVTIRPFTHAPRAWESNQRTTSSASLFKSSCPKQQEQNKRIIQSSFESHAFSENPTYASSNGFVKAAVTAYNHHHHLIIRPEDVWFSIISQFGFFVNGHAEEVRSFFVSHEGQKKLKVIEIGTIDTVDFGPLAVRFSKLIGENVVDPDLKEWIMPDFTTTTKSDRVVASILMMGAMQKYFSYKFVLTCGIPSITLLGTHKDWNNMLRRLEKLSDFGDEPAQFGKLLTPVLSYFVKSFDNPLDPEVISFWRRIAHEGGGSGPIYLSGWITAFCFWDADGKSLFTSPQGPVDMRAFGGKSPGCDLDGTLYHRVDIDNIPYGFASVPVTVDDNGILYKTRMVAGSVGICVSSSGDVLDIGRNNNNNSALSRYGPNGKLMPVNKELPARQVSGLDTVQPLSGWWMYEVTESDGKENSGNDSTSAPSSPDNFDNASSSSRQSFREARRPGFPTVSATPQEKDGNALGSNTSTMLFGVPKRPLNDQRTKGPLPFKDLPDPDNIWTTDTTSKRLKK